MKTVIVPIADAMTAHKHGGHFTPTNSGVVSPGPRAKRTLGELHEHEEWKQRVEDDWQSHFERLQQCVCELLIKNQQLRTALMAANERNRGSRAPRITEKMLQNMFMGNPPGNYDRILDFSTAVTGSLFFVPTATFLDTIGTGGDAPGASEDTASQPPDPPAAPSWQDMSLKIGSLKGECSE